MSSRVPASVTYSLEEFARHGGATADHRDGWGIAYHEGREARVIRDVDAASDSPYVRFVAEQGYQSSIVMAHIRHATQGAVALRNTQPFARELAGRRHLFVHNGDLCGVDDAVGSQVGCYRPVGETDSEHAFCGLLHRLQPLWLDSKDPPTVEQRVEQVVDFAAELRPLGPANFLYTDGDLLIAHGHQRIQEAGGLAEPPGLHLLTRSCAGEGDDFSHAGVTISGRAQCAVLFASVPLTDEPWEPLGGGEVVVARAGSVVARLG